MTSLKLISIISLSVLFCISISSCDKDNLRDNHQIDQDLSEVRSSFDIPLVEKDVIAFRDVPHFKTFYHQLESLKERNSKDLVHFLNSNLDIESIYSIIINDEFKNPDDRFIPVISDDIMYPILNPNYEFIIGENLVTYINDDELLISHINDVETRQKIRGIEKGSDLLVEDIPDEATLAFPSTIFPILVAGATYCGCTLQVEQVDCCDIRMYGTCKTKWFKDGEANLSVQMVNNSGDNQLALNFNYSETVNGAFDITLSDRCLPSESDIEVVELVITLNPLCILTSTVENDFQFVPNIGCDDSTASSGSIWKVEDDREALDYQLSHYKSFFKRITKSSCRSYQFRNGKWHLTDADVLSSFVEATDRTDNCGFKAYDNEIKLCSNCSDVTAKIKTNFFSKPYHCTGDILGEFYKQEAPYILNAENELEFECCQ